MCCDGNQVPVLTISAEAIVQGDASHACISAASIVAKVIRDQLIVAMDRHFPEYGFAKHKGYGTAAHMAALPKRTAHVVCIGKVLRPSSAFGVCTTRSAGMTAAQFVHLHVHTVLCARWDVYAGLASGSSGRPILAMAMQILKTVMAA